MSRSDRNPLVSCIMPTYNRREFVPHAIRYFRRQGYAAKELIIIDDGEDPIADLVPEADDIRYYRLGSKITLGAKLNMACEYANGEIIANWDDDDWYAERRLHYQATSLQKDQTDVCGINRLLYYDLRQHRAHQYTYPKEHRVWLIGSSLCYRKEFWEMHRFADIDVGMDGLFVWSTTPDRITVLPDTAISVHMIHDRNVSPKKTEGAWWQPHPVEEIRTIMREDWDYYHPVAPHFTEPGLKAAGITIPDIPAPDIAAPAIFAPRVTPSASPSATPPTSDPIARPPLRNIYACLVHEKPESILDLVHNLNFHDPDSQIILYNGGTDPQLLTNKRAFESCGASVHPNPTPMTWGYLHNFALHCMEFALANYTFDTLTIVDSDQLAIRSGYSAFLDKALPSREGIGLLSSKCGRISPADSQNHPIAAQGFKEYELWKPLLDSFPDGADKFVHWTFWPSSVFLADAIRDLTKLFRENSLLQQIMRQTKIWASEEVILPTLVRLLGYEIRTNPSSYEFVRFRQLMTLADVREAACKEDVFWMHPVDRRFQDPLRAEIRSRARDYMAPSARIVPLISKIQKIGGWLTSEEADTLSGITLRACKAPAVKHHIVEIGSYHGRSTVLFGSLIKTFQLQATVHAIDMHDGRLGAEDQGLQAYPPSFDIFNRNIREAGVTDVVQVIRDRSTNVNWAAAVSLLFVDGLHDYANVSRDFRQFSAWIDPGGYAAFHDYATYFPGVQTFVNELLLSGEYQKVNLTGSLMILQKRYEQNTAN